MSRSIDFNCDLGEGCGDDAAIAPCISSASIACGGHAGDAGTMREAVALCMRHAVAIGAHPSFEDRPHFGRRALVLPPAEIHALVTRQIAALHRHCTRAGARLAHVKPHGALYNLAATDAGVADAVAAAVHAFDPGLWLYALSGSRLAAAGRRLGLAVAEEAFAERAYTRDGLLAPRDRPGAVIGTLPEALAQVRALLVHGRVTSLEGDAVPLHADTLCLHGDRPDAAGFAVALRAALHAESIVVASPSAAAAAPDSVR